MTEEQRKYILWLITNRIGDRLSDLASHDQWDDKWEEIENDLGLTEEEGNEGVALNMIEEVIRQVRVELVECEDDQC